MAWRHSTGAAWFRCETVAGRRKRGSDGRGGGSGDGQTPVLSNIEAEQRVYEYTGQLMASLVRMSGHGPTHAAQH